MMSENTLPVRVLHYFAFPGGGIGRYVHELLTRLRDQPGVEVELACIPSYHYLQQATYPTWPGLRDITHPVPFRRRMRFAINLLVNPVRAIKRAQLTGAQILHLSTIPHVTFALWSRKLKKAGLRLVATAHDVRRSQGLICYPYEIEQLKRLYRACDALFVHSEYQKKDLIDFAGVSEDKIHIVPHGPSYHGPPQGDKMTLRKRYGVPLDKQVALFFGDIRPDKNLDLFLQAMVPYKDRLFLVVAGQAKRGTSISQLKSLANELGLHEDVHVKWMTYYIPYEEVPNLFTLADWLALPYSRSFTSQSGVLNIAIPYNLPVLASDLPTIGEPVRRYKIGTTVAPDSVQELSRGIANMLNNTSTFYTDGFQKVAQISSWDTNVSITSSVYLTLPALTCTRSGAW